MSLSPKSKKTQNTFFTFSAGFTLPTVMLFVMAFVAIPLVFWYVSANARNDGEVQGVQSKTNKEGFYIQIVSQVSPWDLFEYLCKTKEECVSKLESGKHWQATSGGATTGTSIKIDYSDLWSGYSYLKIYVKPGKGSGTASFVLNTPLDSQELETQQLDGTSVLLVPITYIKDNHYGFIVFDAK